MYNKFLPQAMSICMTSWPIIPACQCLNCLFQSKLTRLQLITWHMEFVANIYQWLLFRRKQWTVFVGTDLHFNLPIKTDAT